MRFLLATIGSEGDIQPFLALGKGLAARGHSVSVATHDKYAPRILAQGLAHVAIGSAWEDAKSKDYFARILAEPNPMRQLVLVIELLQEEQLVAVDQLRAIVPAFDAIVYTPVFVAASAAARAADKPHVSVHFAPLHRASAYGPTGTNLGPLGNRLVWWLVSALLRRATDGPLNEIVTRAGLPPWRDVLLESSHSTLLDLVTVSPTILPKDPAWRPETKITGFLYLEEAPFAPPAQLEAFMAETPVVVGFGSMTGMDPQARTQVVIDAVRDLDRKVILQTGWAGLGSADLPPNVHVTGFVPHQWLFERAACVVHHGGAGTTGATLRAGVPQAIVWHLGDQPVWGNKVEELGVGPKCVSHRKLTSTWLRSAIDRMLTDEPMKVRARSVGKMVAAEDGVGAACTAIEAALR